MEVQTTYPRIQFIDFKITNLGWKIDSLEKTATVNLEAKINQENEYNLESKHQFLAKFNIDLIDDKDLVHINIKATSIFSSDIEITKDLENHPIFLSNAPAIAYPYLRAFLSTLTLNAGYNSIILPVFSFLKIEPPKEV